MRLLLNEVLKKNGDEHLYNQIMDLTNKIAGGEHPPIIFVWKNLEDFVRVVNAAHDSVPVPPPSSLILTPNMTVCDFKTRIIELC
jgi:hypothetical protein